MSDLIITSCSFIEVIYYHSKYKLIFDLYLIIHQSNKIILVSVAINFAKNNRFRESNGF